MTEEPRIDLTPARAKEIDDIVAFHTAETEFYTVNDDGYVFLLEARRGLDGWELVDVFDRYDDAHPEACYEITLGEFDTLDELVRHLEDEAA